jgi:amino acid permease
MLSYTCQLNVLPISNLLKNKTTESYKKTCQLAIGLSTIFYLIIAVLGIYIYGTVIVPEFEFKKIAPI